MMIRPIDNRRERLKGWIVTAKHWLEEQGTGVIQMMMGSRRMLFQGRAILVTQKIATQLLENAYEKQRTFRPWLCRRYESEMIEDRWGSGEVVIKLLPNGAVANGQHTLTAIKKTGKPQWCYIEMDVPYEAYKYMDRGKQRAVADALKMNGEKNCNALQAAVGTAICYKKEQMVTKSWSPGTDECLEYLKQHAHIRESVARWRSSIGKIAPAGPACGLHSVLWEISDDEADEYYEDLASGAIGDANDPALKVREKLLYNRRPTVQSKLPRQYQLALIVLAWNYRRQGKQPKTVRWPGGAFPRAI